MSNENDPQAKEAPSPTVEEILGFFTHIEPIMLRLKTDHAGEDWVGFEECPVCHGTLYVGTLKLLGHTYGKCETVGCINWIE